MELEHEEWEKDTLSLGYSKIWGKAKHRGGLQFWGGNHMVTI